MTHEVLGALKKAQLLITSGQFKKAELLCKKVLKQNPYQPDSLHLLGYSALQRKDYSQAIDSYKKALQQRSNEANYHYNIGLAYLKSMQFKEAVNHLQRALEINPKFNAAYSDLCLALTKTNNSELAIKAGKKAVKLNPNDAAAHNNLALAYDAYQKYDVAYTHYEKAAALSPEKISVKLDLGYVYVGRGEFDKAKQCFYDVIKLEPNQITAYSNLVRITKYSSPDDDDAEQLKVILKQKHLSDDERSSVLFSLGKIYQDCRLYDEAFDYYLQGNKLQDDKHNFDPAIATKAVSLLIKHCASDLFTKTKSLGHASKSPIFVVGTPRSGTTLTEQILSSHPDVFGAGELHWMPDAADNLQHFLKSSREYPECMHELTKQPVNQLAIKYLRYIKSLANNEDRVVDKMPGNFLHLGFIHCLFPNAKIIHCRREPRDACVSMFCNYFPDAVTYSYDLYKLGAFYSQYELAMEHWHKVLPSETLIDIDYETLVQNQEQETRRLLKFIGLDWHDDCLKFYEKKRRVNTASDTQVTKPIYTSSISRWKRYKDHLQKLEDGFNYAKDSQ